ncbi:MFS transporter [Cerasicoccus arenae]|uniref:MFS transporter n=1 Tax=Cerasicoccus arenae TaxID=424488 RepID=A0A8J3GDV5_9BACT|nr:MFS transporter [Cerasicoccus arenae]MBK1858623.1 MFS transporter [Cerasicoccus arenae]GHC04936.1 MFS transporter [Cerasicoccus arenae]
MYSPDTPPTESELYQEASAKTVQEYIDECPVWSDGTKSSVTPMTVMQWRIWMLASAGKFFEGMVVFMTGVCLPLISVEFGLSAADKGFVTAATLAGILVGASALGGLSDLVGRKTMFIAEMVIFTVFLIALSLAPNFFWLVVFLFGVGVALGCDYPTAHLVISESIPTSMRGRLVLSAFAFQAIGALMGTIIGCIILLKDPAPSAWRWMYATAIIPAVLVVIGRFFVTDSVHWLVSKGRMEDAEYETKRLLNRRPQYPKEVKLRHTHDAKKPRPKAHYGLLFNKDNRKATILASLPWFLQDLSTYGIGIFTPTILAAMIGAKTSETTIKDIIHNDMLASKGSAIMDILFVLGIVCAIMLVDRVGRIKLQIIGFIGCALGLLLAGLSMNADGGNNMLLLFVGFMLFFFMTNLGPNAMTYLIAGEVFPTHVRGMGAGFAASFAKIGAVLTAFLFPILLADIGTEMLLFFLVGASVLGAVVTFIFAIETRGLNLETIGQRQTDEEVEFEREADAELA